VAVPCLGQHSTILHCSPRYLPEPSLSHDPGLGLQQGKTVQRLPPAAPLPQPPRAECVLAPSPMPPAGSTRLLPLTHCCCLFYAALTGLTNSLARSRALRCLRAPGASSLCSRHVGNRWALEAARPLSTAVPKAL